MNFSEEFFAHKLPRGGMSAPPGEPAGGPDWFANLADKTWTAIAAGGTLADVVPNPLPSGNTGQASIIIAQTGGSVDTAREALMLLANGGHGDYMGNEVYKLSLNEATPVWERLTTPSTTVGTGSAMSDGRPRSSHTAGQVCYAPNTDKFYLTGMQYFWQDGNSSRDMYAFIPSTNEWESRTALPSGYGVGGFMDGGSVYDASLGKIWIIATNADGTTDLYDPVANTHQFFDDLYFNHGAFAMVGLHPTKRAICVINGAVGARFSVADADSPVDFVSVTRSGTWPTVEGLGFGWSASSNAFIAWEGGATLYKITAPAGAITDAWTSATVAATGGNPGTLQQNGCHGKFGIINDFAGTGRDLIVVAMSLTSTYVYKLPAGGV